MYKAIVNTPGYLPENDPVVFDTAREAWEYLLSEYRDGLRDDPSAEQAIKNQADAQPPYELGSVVATDNEAYIYDLGMAYTVDEASEEDMYPGPLGEELPCGCRPHITRMGAVWGFYCETEEQGYCNFECPHEDED